MASDTKKYVTVVAIVSAGVVVCQLLRRHYQRINRLSFGRGSCPALKSCLSSSKFEDLSVVQAELESVQNRISKYIRCTELEMSHWLSDCDLAVGRATTEVYFKLDNDQVTGSFKVRGAINRMLSLTPEERAHGIVTASTGNHALAVAYAASICPFAVDYAIYLPTTVSQSKLQRLQEMKANLQFYGTDSSVTELHAAQVANDSGKLYVSPYNDPLIIAGQASIAVEIVQQLKGKRLDNVFVSVGGGGLISGIALYLKSVDPSIRVVGCQPEVNACLYQSLKATRIVTEKDGFVNGETMSDGTAGGMDVDSITFPVCQQLVDEWILVSEEEIQRSVRDMLEKHHKVIEGAAGCAVAAYRKSAQRFRNTRSVIVLCGGNLSMKHLKQVANLDA